MVRLSNSAGKRVILSFFTIILLSCVTINIYFPAEEVRKTAQEIVGEVRGTESKKQINDQSKKTLEPQSFYKFLIGVKIAYGQKELNVSNAAIRTIKKRMKERFPSLEAFFNRGNIGEGLNGFIVIRTLNGLSFQEKAKLKKLVKEENQDRNSLYAEVVRSLNIDPSQTSKVAAIFAEQWQKSAHSGWWIEIEPNKWIKKQ